MLSHASFASTAAHAVLWGNYISGVKCDLCDTYDWLASL